jgi:CRISPR-associated protein Cst1
MIEEKTTINKEWLTRTTGDPFADIGGLVIQRLWEQKPNRTILQLIEETAKIYVNNWSGKVHPFFLNSTITQPAFKGDRKITETLKFYKGLIENTLPYEEGYCRILGEYTEIFTAGRDNHILSGSGTFMNFHHFFQGGLMLSKEVLIRTFFVPFGTVLLSDKIALLTSNEPKITQLFVDKIVIANQDKIGKGNAEGILRSEFNKPANAIFEFANDCIREIRNKENVTLNLFHFTNFGAAPEVQLYTLPANVYKFYAWVSKHRKVADDWKLFIRKHYRNSKAKDLIYNETTDIFEYQVKKDMETADFKTFKNWYNPVLNNLLYGKSILNLILKWTENHSFNLNIVKTYQTYIRNMNAITLEKIEHIADFVLEDKNEAKKLVTRVRGFEDAYSFKRFLVTLQEKNHANRAEKPLFSMKDYVDYLFPEGTSWKEIRTLLLICLYQKMHEQEIFFDNQPISE